MNCFYQYRRSNKMKTLTKLLAVLVMALALLHPGTTSAKQKAAPKFPPQMREQVKYLSTKPMLLRAEMMGITVIEGKDITGGNRAKTKRGRGHDVPIGVHPVIHENEPTVAANPVDSQRLVAGSHFIREFENSCVAYTSSNGGASWT